MGEARWTKVWMGLLLSMAFGIGARSTAHADEADTRPLPRTLRGGTAASRLPSSAPKKAPAPARPTPAPSIQLDRRPSAAQEALGKRRNEALLQREIGLLTRLIANLPHNDLRRADVLLRLSYAYQDLMLLQKARMYRLQDQRGSGCDCGATAVASAPALLAPAQADLEVAAARAHQLDERAVVPVARKVHGAF